MTNAPKVCVRTRRLKSLSAVNRAERHGKRIGPGVDHCDRNAPEPNKAASRYADDPLNLSEAVLRSVELRGAKFRKGASVAQHLLFTFTPDFFTPPAPGPRFDMQKVETVWAYVNAYLKKEFGDGLVAARMDLDESTPHIDAFIVPVSTRITKRGRQKREVSVRDIFGRPYHLSALQTSFALHMAPLGFVRGTPKTVTQAVNRPFREFHQEVLERSELINDMRLQLEEKAEEAAFQEAEDNRAYRQAWAEVKLEREAFGTLLTLFRRNKVQLIGTETAIKLNIDNDALPPLELAKLERALAASPMLARSAVDICLNIQGLQGQRTQFQNIEVEFCDAPRPTADDEGFEQSESGSMGDNQWNKGNHKIKFG